MDSKRSNKKVKPILSYEDSLSDATKPLRPRRIFKHRSTSNFNEHKSASVVEYESDASMSDSEELEMDPLVSSVDADEETGLTAKERKKYASRQRQRGGLDVRIAGGAGAGSLFSQTEAKAADRQVIRRSLVNAALILMWYFFSLSISIYNKWMFTPGQLNFPYPLFTTSLHMIVQFSLASTVIFFIPSLRPYPPQSSTTANGHIIKSTKPSMSSAFYFTRLVPTGTATSLDIGLGNMSLRFITLTFYTMCKSSVLIFVLTFAFVFRLEAPSIKLLLIILFMTGGVLMMVAGETAFDALGCALALTASFFSGLRWALTQILLLRHSATHNPFATMFFLTPIMFLTLFVLALFAEKPTEVIQGVQLLVQHRGLGETILILIVPGFLAFCMIASEYTLLQRTNVVTLSICGIFKEVVTIGAAELVFDDKLTAINIGGLMVTIVCIACYNYIKVTKMRREARDRVQKGELDPQVVLFHGPSEEEEGMDGDDEDDEEDDVYANIDDGDGDDEDDNNNNHEDDDESADDHHARSKNTTDTTRKFARDGVLSNTIGARIGVSSSSRNPGHATAQ